MGEEVNAIEYDMSEFFNSCVEVYCKEFNVERSSLSKNVANFDWAVVLPPQGPPVSTNLKTRLVGGRPCVGAKNFMVKWFSYAIH